MNYIITIALKSGTNINYLISEDKLEQHTRGLFEIVKNMLQGNVGQVWTIHREPNQVGPVTFCIGAGEIAAFSICKNEPENIESFHKEFMHTQLEVLKLQKQIFAHQLKKLDEGEDWKA